MIRCLFLSNGALPSKRFIRISLLGIFLLLPFSVTAYEAIVPDPPLLSAESYILMDYHTAMVLAEKRADAAHSPASLTKVMTAYVVYQALEDGLIHLSDQVNISRKARQAIGSRMFVEQGSKVAVEDLLLGVVVQSGNDASIALAEYVGGSEAGFADLMNAQANRLGLTNSYFMNATGLSEKNHYMTARDNAILIRSLIQKFPTHYRVYAQKEYIYNNIRQYNRNQLLWRNLGVDGVKTGYTEAAGYCFSASAKRDGMRLIAVILGSSGEQQRLVDAERLFNYGFRFYKTYRLYQAGKSLHQLRVWGGKQKYVRVGVPQDFYVTVPRNATGQLEVEKTIHQAVDAPVNYHQPLGVVAVNVTEKSSQSMPLVALTPVQKGSWIIRLYDAFLKLF